MYSSTLLDTFLTSSANASICWIEASTIAWNTPLIRLATNPGKSTVAIAAPRLSTVYGFGGGCSSASATAAGRRPPAEGRAETEAGGGAGTEAGAGAEAAAEAEAGSAGRSPIAAASGNPYVLPPASAMY